MNEHLTGQVEINKELTKTELHKIIREHIIHEDNLNNHRMTWLLASQSIIFVAYYLVMVSVLDKETSLVTVIKLISLAILNTMGQLFSNFVTAKIWAGAIALKQLRHFWFQKYPEEGQYDANNVLAADEEYVFEDLRPHESKQLPDINFLTNSFDGDAAQSKVWLTIRNFDRELLSKVQLRLLGRLYDRERYERIEKRGRALVTPMAFTLVMIWRLVGVLTILVILYEGAFVALKAYKVVVLHEKSIIEPVRMDTVRVHIFPPAVAPTKTQSLDTGRKVIQDSLKTDRIKALVSKDSLNKGRQPVSMPNKVNRQ